jgi:hypothetical protein
LKSKKYLILKEILSWIIDNVYHRIICALMHFWLVFPLRNTHNMIFEHSKEIKNSIISGEFDSIHWLQSLNSRNRFVYQKALIRTFKPAFLLQSNVCEFTAREHKVKRLFCTQNPVLNVCFKDFWYTKINLTKIWYDEFN